MADRYWVGNTSNNNWDASTKTYWSTSSGGAGGASVPTASDNVFFDANSANSTLRRITITANANCLNLDCTGFIGRLDGSNSYILRVYGNLKFVSSMDYIRIGQTILRGPGNGLTIETGGQNLRNITMAGDGTGNGEYTLIDDLNATDLYLNAGTIITNNKNIILSNIFSSLDTLSQNRYLYLGSSTVTCSNWYATSYLTLDEGTSTIKCNFTNFTGGGLTYNNVWFYGSVASGVTVTGSNTYNDFKCDKTIENFISFEAGSTQTFSTFTVNGTAPYFTTIKTASGSTNTHNLVKTGGGVINCSFLNIQHSVATPADTWYAKYSVDNQSVDTAGSGWIISPLTANLVTKGDSEFSNLDILRIKDDLSDEWLKVLYKISSTDYVVERDLAGVYTLDNNPEWKKGATIVNYGQSGDGGIYMTASETNAPYLSMFDHAGAPWSTLNTRLRIGNLNGYLGYSTDLYGIAIGEATKYLKYDPTNGLRIAGNITLTDGSAIDGGYITDNTIFASKLRQLVPSTDGSVSFTGSWTENNIAAHYFKKSYSSTTAGDYFEIQFTGEIITLFGVSASYAGQLEIKIDGVVDTAVLDLYSSDGLRSRYAFYTKTGLSNIAHTLKATVLPTYSGTGIRIDFNAYSTDPSLAISLESMDFEAFSQTYIVTTNANGYYSLAPGTPTGYTSLGVLHGRLSTTFMDSSAANKPKIGSRYDAIQIYDGAASTSYSLSVTMVISKTT